MNKLILILACLVFAGTINATVALNIPKTFEASMLAVEGVPKAQIIVGAMAPGRNADLESAKVIKNAVAEKLRVNVTRVSKGTKLDKDLEKYSFLKKDVWVFFSWKETKIPKLNIRDETMANKSMNLVLIGGPVANNLTAELVRLNKSKINWYTSSGDIEVIPDAYTIGNYAIIAAGEDRDTTRHIAEVLALSL